MEITKREIIASISIIAFMLIIGTLISRKIGDSVEDKNSIYNKALKIESSELFDYGMRTNVGNAFVYGSIKAIDGVKYDDLKGEYLYIKKVTEKHTKHIRTYTVRTKYGTQTRTQVYYTWDEIGKEIKKSEKVEFLDKVFKTNQFNLPYASHVKTVKFAPKLRYVYYAIPTQIDGTIFATLKDNDIGKNVDIYRDKKTDETYKDLINNHSEIIFKIFWFILTVGLVCGFYYIDNDWLE